MHRAVHGGLAATARGPALPLSATMTTSERRRDGASSTDLLLEVRTEWSTDLAVIYITTPNANNPNDTTNITDEVVLNEISWLEGDDRNH